jgi:hypothetical protein
MIAHTPGPWHMNMVSAKTRNIGVYDPSGTEVARVNVKSALVEQRREADARLLSASTELLAALIRLRDLDVNCTQAEDVAAWKQAHDAIAKATGSTSA